MPQPREVQVQESSGADGYLRLDDYLYERESVFPRDLLDVALEVVPRSVAEALAEALGNEEALSSAGYKAWAEYRARHPKETP